jgi:serine/threonine protein kinase
LYELIKQNSFGGLSTQLVKVFTAQLLDALTILNEAKLIHCDLKPENILLKSYVFFAPFTREKIPRRDIDGVRRIVDYNRLKSR